MKIALLVLSYMLQDAGYVVAHLEHGKCSACVRAGVESVVWAGRCASTTAYCPSYYDMKGNYVVPKCNRTVCENHCSMGHSVVEVIQ